jgi:hypothetical protein
MTTPLPDGFVHLPDGLLPVEQLLQDWLGDTSSDYADGDHPGYFRWSWDDVDQVLTVRYEHSEAEETGIDLYGQTEARFQLIAVVEA